MDGKPEDTGGEKGSEENGVDDDAVMDQKKKRGTPCYMAPELFTSRGVYSIASDLWSLGCVLYELTFGQPPFVHTDLTKLVSMIQKSPPPHLEKDQSKISPALRSLLASLLRKDPCDRLTWDTLLQHRFWRGIEMPRLLSMPKQPLFEAYVLYRLETSEGPDEIDADSAGESFDGCGATSSEDGDYGNGGEAEEEDESSAEAVKLSTDEFKRSVCGPPAHAWEARKRTPSPGAKEVKQAERPREERPKTANPSPKAPASANVGAATRPSTAPSAAHRGMRGDGNVNDGNFDAGSTLPATSDAFLFKCCAPITPESFDGLLRHPREVRVLPIVGNATIAPLPSIRFRSQELAFDAAPPADVFAMGNEELQSFLGSVYNSLNASPSSRRGLGRATHVLGYLYLICQNSRLANIIVNSR